MRKTYSWLIVLILLVSGVYADITFSGDARVRPRLDIKDNGAYGNQTNDIYYLYRARILLAADIGDGYFFKTRLGHNGVAYWVGKFGTGDLPGSSTTNAGRGSVDFMELYFGHNGASFGWAAGLIPVGHNPLKDIHFYPSKPLDLPWVIFGNNAAHGFDFNYKLAGNKLDLKVIVDNNSGFTTYVDGNAVDSLSATDQYTFNASYPISIAGIKLTPELLMTVADAGNAAPMTYGATIGLPKVAGFSMTAYFGLTSQQAADTDTYTGWIGRAKMVGKMGPGKLTAWYDLAATTSDFDGAQTDNFSYLWLSYTYTLHKSDKGALTIAPTYRLLSQNRDDSATDVLDGVEYTRAKIEVTTQITFK